VATLVSTYVGALAGDEALSNARIEQVLAGAPPLAPSQAASGPSEPVDGPTGPVAVIVRLRDEDADALGEGSLPVHMGAVRPEDMTRTPCGTTRRKCLRGVASAASPCRGSPWLPGSTAAERFAADQLAPVVARLLALMPERIDEYALYGRGEER
jgi:hypothetical protein